jgi:2-amino-4-hydroxy-6-hydroxymethyldihydropteridine diphosphokinase
MHKIFLALGSNVGNKKDNIQNAIKLLKDYVYNVEIAPFYISKAVGYEAQDDFVNTVIKGYTQLDPFELLKVVKNIEKEVGRIYRFHWGPREIDIDILFFDEVVINTENLKIPHPRLHERDFVLLPLKDLDENLIHPILNKSVKDLVKELKEKSVIGKMI